MEAKCKQCGRPLHDPVSIVRGMGAKCAGLARSGNSFHASRNPAQGTAAAGTGGDPASLIPFSPPEDHPDEVSAIFKQFPSDLVNLVLCPSTPGSIAPQVKAYSRHQGLSRRSGARLLRQLRWLCIELRLVFWPGMFMNQVPIPCVPHGENDWKLGGGARIMSKEELVDYLRRSGVLSAGRHGHPQP